jgi:hypothetical protein
MSIIPALRKLKQKDLEFKASLGYIVKLRPTHTTYQDPDQKQTDRGVVQMGECLPSKCEALSSNPTTIKKKPKVQFQEAPS